MAIVIIDRVIDQEVIQMPQLADLKVNLTADQEVNQTVDQEVSLTVDQEVSPSAGQTVNPSADQIVLHRADYTADPDSHSSTDDFRIPGIYMDHYYLPGEKVNGYTVHGLIGEGRYGIAYLAINESNEKCVIKQLKKETLNETRDKLFYEVQILQDLKSPHFLKFISKYEDEISEGYLLEYIEGAVFEDLIIRDGYQFSKEEIYHIGSQLLELIEELQSHHVVHRDIRPPNVILKDNHEIVLIDFGLARIIDDERYVKETDYWYLGDFLITLYYSSYKETESDDRPWFEELDLSPEEEIFLKKLMGIDESYHDIKEIKDQLEQIKKMNLP